MKTQEVPEISAAELLKRQNDLKARLERPRFEFLPIASYLCKAHNVSDVWQIVPFGKRVNAWEVMRSVTVGIEVGSVVKGADEKPHIFQFNLEPEDSAEKQVYKCPFDPSLPWCKFLDSPMPKPDQLFKNPVTGVPMPVDLDKACVYNIVCRNVWSSVPINVAGRLNFYHKGIDALQQSEQQDNLFAAAGGVKGAFLSIAATKVEGLDIQVVPMPALGFSCTNDFFTATMALLNDVNIMNGIIEIPNSVCLEARLPVYRGAPDPSEAFLASAMQSLTLGKDGHPTEILSEEQKARARDELTHKFKAKWDEQTANSPKIKTFFAVPINHVFAWGLQSEDYAAQHGYRAEQFRFIPPPNDMGIPLEPIVLYFLVADVFFHTMVAEFKRVWMNKVDMRPLSSMAFEFLPQLDRAKYPNIPPNVETVQGLLSLRSYVTFMAPPRLAEATINQLAPALSINFPSCYDWSIDELARQMAIDEHLDSAVLGKKK